ncbi:MAG: phytanoyl-CoA dioxygenase family protein [Lentisphaerae bacterium]|nr:phytanoyl-CoA dioxygenase family protein [Lentisphaerota bacterium]
METKDGMAVRQADVDVAALYVARATAVAIGSLSDLDDEAIRRYEESGYLAVTQALTLEEARQGTEALTELILRPVPEGYQVQFEGQLGGAEPPQGEARLDAVRKLMSFVKVEPRLNAIASHPHLIQAVERLAGGPVRLFQDMALIKPPRGGREKPWHQDKAYFDYPLDTRVVGVWIALDEVTVANGCMHVMPGSHREGPQPHFTRRDWQICDTHIMGKSCVAVPLPPGGLLFFDGLLAHGTPPNTSHLRRRALQFHYAPVSVGTVDPAIRLHAFGGEGRHVTC